MGDGIISEEMAQEALEKLEVDPLGLDRTDHRLLGSIIDKFTGGPVGLDTLAASIGEEADTIMDVYEPYLLKLGFLDRTPVAGWPRPWPTPISTGRPQPRPLRLKAASYNIRAPTRHSRLEMGGTK